jgi:hypothetical protein
LAEFSAQHGFRVVENGFQLEWPPQSPVANLPQSEPAGRRGRASRPADALRVEQVEAARAAQGRRVVVVDGAKVINDSVRDLHEVIVSMCEAVRQEGREEPGKEKSYGGHRVRVVRSHRIALFPTAAQQVLLRQALSVSRFSYNRALAEWKRQYRAGEEPSEGVLRRQLNAIKREQFPWMGLVPKSVPQLSHQELRDGV